MSARFETGGTVALAEVGGRALSVTLERVEQRNWSRIAHARDERGGAWFLKQSVDRAGRRQPDLFRWEAQGARLAERALAGVAIVPRLVLADPEHLVHVFEHVPLETPDELLRRDPGQCKELLPHALERMLSVLQALAEARPEGLEELEPLPVKRRPYGGPPTALGFKGFEIRNCGFALDARGRPSDGRLALFDFGRPYRAPVEELAAKLYVSVGMLNWGKPLRRFALGPDEAAMHEAREVLEPLLDHEAVLAEIALQRAFRLREVQSRGQLDGALKRLGLHMLGRRYFERLERCARRVA